ncbi:MAG: hypothetical protein LBP76_03040 [Treponema sp.]|jgi:hypothetical protein|nr:hypothetical protein [Treponema sp.]
MKKHSVLMGLLSVLLMAGLMFSACPMDNDDDDDDGGLSAPSTEDLPGLPENTAYVTKDGAEALLGTVKNVFESVSSAFQGVIEKEFESAEPPEDGKYFFEVKDDTSVEGLKINVTGNGSFSSNPPDMTENHDFKAGDYYEKISHLYAAADFTSDKEEAGVTIRKGSSIQNKADEYQKVSSIKDATTQQQESEKSSMTGGLTVYSDGKGGKIILEANKVEDSKRESGEDKPTVNSTYTGFLAVYGQDDTEVYKLVIENEETYKKALAYFYSGEDEDD